MEISMEAATRRAFRFQIFLAVAAFPRSHKQHLEEELERVGARMKAFRKLSRRFRGIPSKDKENYTVPEGNKEKARKAEAELDPEVREARRLARLAAERVRKAGPKGGKAYDKAFERALKDTDGCS